MIARRMGLVLCRTGLLLALAGSGPAGLAGQIASEPLRLAQRAPASGGTNAPVPAAGAARAEFESFLKSTRGARGSFRQQVLHASGRVLETTEGSFAFARPGRFRWETDKPYQQMLVADGERLFFFDRDLNQVTVRVLGDAIASTPAAILFGNESIERDFVLTEAGLHDGLLWLEAIPRTRDGGLERIVIGLRAGLPEAMDVVDAFGRTSRFTFGALERNPAMDATLFAFRVPAGADVIRQ